MKGQIETISSTEIEQFNSKLFTNQLETNKSTRKDDLPPISMLSVEEVLKSRVMSLDMDENENENDNAFFVADLGEIYRQDLRWKTHLPRVEPFYGKLNEINCNTGFLIIIINLHILISNFVLSSSQMQ
jgi:hypothetical protein